MDITTRPNPDYKTFRRNRSLHLPAFDYAAPHVFFITIGTHQKQPLLSKPQCARTIFDCLVSCRDRYGYYDHVVRSEESLSGIAEYILDNPVRRGMAANRNEYDFCGMLDEIPG